MTQFPNNMMKLARLTIATATLLSLGSVLTASPARSDAGHGDHGGHTPAEVPHSDGGHGDGAHGHHTPLEVSADQPVPRVSLAIAADPIGGWNLQITTENWRFAPERVNTSSLSTEGHAHLYVNGEKVTRIYSEWYYLPSLPPGEHTLTVSLNANGHEALTYQGQPIEASVVVTVPAR